MPSNFHPTDDAETLLAQVDREHAEAAARRRRAQVTQQHYLDTARSEGRTVLTPEETAITNRAFDDRLRATDDVRRLSARRAEIQAIIDDENEYQRRARQSVPGGQPVAVRARPAYDRVARIGYEARTYRPDEDPNGRRFLLDVTRNFLFQDPVAAQRLAQHMTEERVERPGWSERAAGDATTSAFAGLTVPQYLTDLYAPATAALRPLADNCNQHPLPPQGMTIDISRITTATSAAIQTTELTAVSATSIDDTLLAVPVQTIAGSQNVSRQAIDRGAGIEDVTMSDLFARVATTLDNTLINQASTGLTNVAQSTTYTSASPTGAELWPFLFQAHSKLETALLGYGRSWAVVLHPRRWHWLSSQVGSTWPFLGAQGSSVAPQQFGFQLTNEYGPSVRARLNNGDLVIVDANVPTNLGGGTNQDEIYVVALNEIHLWEDPNSPVMIRAEQPNAASLGVLLVAYQYAAYTAQRYSNNPGKVTGTGLVAPSGF